MAMRPAMGGLGWFDLIGKSCEVGCEMLMCRNPVEVARWGYEYVSGWYTCSSAMSRLLNQMIEGRYWLVDIQWYGDIMAD